MKIPFEDDRFEAHIEFDGRLYYAHLITRDHERHVMPFATTTWEAARMWLVARAADEPQDEGEQ